MPVTNQTYVGTENMCYSTTYGEYLNVACNDPRINTNCEKCNSKGIVTFTSQPFGTINTTDTNVVFTSGSKISTTGKLVDRVENNGHDTVIVDFDLSWGDKDPTSPCDTDDIYCEDTISSDSWITINGIKKQIITKIGSLSGCKELCHKDDFCFFPSKMICDTKNWGQNCSMN